MGIYNDDDFLLRSYLRDIDSFGLITPEEEVKLARKIAQGDDDAREMMTKANLRLVVKIAHDYDRFGLPLIDLINEGNTGLMKAVGKFDPNKGAKFSTYAAWWIKQAIKRALGNNVSTIRIPVHMVSHISRVSRFERDFLDENGREPTDEEILEELGLRAPNIRLAIRARNGCKSIHEKIHYSDGDSETLESLIPDENAEMSDKRAEINEQAFLLSDLLDSLSPREKNIIEIRFGLNGKKQMTLEQIGKIYRLTRERVRQIEAKAIKKLKEKFRKKNSQIDPDLPKSIYATE